MSPPTTPTKPLEHKEADTVQKSRFFEAFDSRTRSKESLRSLAIKHGITRQTACNWLKKRRIQGSPPIEEVESSRSALVDNQSLQKIKFNVFSPLQIPFEINTISIKLSILISPAVFVHFKHLFESIQRMLAAKSQYE
jgi:hypothetical protein